MPHSRQTTQKNARRTGTLPSGGASWRHKRKLLRASVSPATEARYLTLKGPSAHVGPVPWLPWRPPVAIGFACSINPSDTSRSDGVGSTSTTPMTPHPNNLESRICRRDRAAWCRPKWVELGAEWPRRVDEPSTLGPYQRMGRPWNYVGVVSLDGSRVASVFPFGVVAILFRPRRAGLHMKTPSPLFAWSSLLRRARYGNHRGGLFGIISYGIGQSELTRS